MNYQVKILTAIDDALDKVAQQKAIERLSGIKRKISIRLSDKKIKSKYEKKAYNSLIAYLNLEIQELKR
jgi:hypothetical protein